MNEDYEPDEVVYTATPSTHYYVVQGLTRYFIWEDWDGAEGTKAQALQIADDLALQGHEVRVVKRARR